MAKQKTESQRIGTVMGAALGILGLAGLADIEHVAGGFDCVFAISLKMALETLLSIPLMVWHILQTLRLDHMELLEGLLQASVSWHFILTVTGA